jgi:uracil-DNA glycosylase
MTVDDLQVAFQTLPKEWSEILPGWTSSAPQTLINKIRAVSGQRQIAPPDPFRALRFSSPAAVKVVIFGQDPYPGPGVADGLAFSANAGKPPSLRRVFDVLEADRSDYVRPSAWKLDRWAKQGVLLLNPTLTIEVGAIASHINCGWQHLTSEIVSALVALPTPPVFMLWGKFAQTFFDSIEGSLMRTIVLRTRHPSNDFKRQFMSEGSHFLATQHLINWWLSD